MLRLRDLLAFPAREHVDGAQVVDERALDAAVGVRDKLRPTVGVIAVERLHEADQSRVLQVVVRGEDVIRHVDATDQRAHERDSGHHDGLPVFGRWVVQVPFD